MKISSPFVQEKETAKAVIALAQVTHHSLFGSIRSNVCMATKNERLSFLQTAISVCNHECYFTILTSKGKKINLHRCSIPLSRQ